MERTDADDVKNGDTCFPLDSNDIQPAVTTRRGVSLSVGKSIWLTLAEKRAGRIINVV